MPPSRRVAGPSSEEAWSRVAPTYATTFARFTALAIGPLLDELGVAAGMDVLDLACGPGLVAAAARDRGARVSGADFSYAMVKLARSAVPDAPLAQADAHALPWRAESFDAVAANFGVHTLVEPRRAFREVARVLRGAGCFAFTVWDATERSEAQRLLERAVLEHGDQPAEPYETTEFVDSAAAAGALVEAGFAPPRSRALELVLRAGGGGEIFEIFRTGTIRLAARLAGHSPEALDAIREEFIRSLAPWSGPNGVAVPMSAILHASRRS